MSGMRRTQHLYLKELESGPKTTRDMSLSLMVSGSSVARMMKKLRDAGLVRSSRVHGVHGNVWEHRLTELVEGGPPSESEIGIQFAGRTDRRMADRTAKEAGVI